MCGFTHTFLSPSSHGKLPVCQGRCSKVSFKKVKEVELYFSPDALHIFVYIYLFYTTMGSIVPAGSPLSNGRNVREPQELRRDANPKCGGV